MGRCTTIFVAGARHRTPCCCRRPSTGRRCGRRRSRRDAAARACREVPANARRRRSTTRRCGCPLFRDSPPGPTSDRPTRPRRDTVADATARRRRAASNGRRRRNSRRRCRTCGRETSACRRCRRPGPRCVLDDRAAADHAARRPAGFLRRDLLPVHPVGGGPDVAVECLLAFGEGGHRLPADDPELIVVDDRVVQHPRPPGHVLALVDTGPGLAVGRVPHVVLVVTLVGSRRR